MKRSVVAAVAFVILGGGVGVWYVNGGQLPSMGLKAAEKSPAPAARVPTVPVVVAHVERTAVPVRIEAIGMVQPIASVAIKSRIDGMINQVMNRDGQDVKAGDVLFQLDQRQVEAQWKQSEAQLARDRAQLAQSKRDVERLSTLIAKDFVSRQSFDKTSTDAAALEATVKADEAAVENWKVQSSYYTIRAPMDGRVGVVSLKAGNNVKANDTISLVTINQVHPIYVNFAVPQRDLAGVRTAMKAGPVEVEVRTPGDSGAPEKGKLGFFENAIDATTGTIAVRGVFDNPTERLWPGQFVNVTATLKIESDVLTVPSAALQVGPNSTYVFVIKPDNSAEMRTVSANRTIQGMTVISEGLKEGETVVIDGHLRLSNGTKVDIKDNSKGKAAAAS